jgi:NADP-dependent 3-hydroxy acid dehydrogenase YdfG
MKPFVGDKGRVWAEHRSHRHYTEDRTLPLVAGAAPLIRPLQQQSWETFSVQWQSNVRIAFHWLREALLEPLRPGSGVVVLSSGAALAGSPLSVGYAGAKATQPQRAVGMEPFMDARRCRG